MYICNIYDIRLQVQAVQGRVASDGQTVRGEGRCATQSKRTAACGASVVPRWYAAAIRGRRSGRAGASSDRPCLRRRRGVVGASELRARRVCGWEWPSGGEGPGAFGGPTPAEGGGARLTAGRQGSSNGRPAAPCGQPGQQEPPPGPAWPPSAVRLAERLGAAEATVKIRGQ